MKQQLTISRIMLYLKSLILVHVCHRWRQIILASPYRLHLRILCTPRTPVRDLGIWPTLMPGNELDVIAALEHPDCVWSVVLPVTGPQLGKVAAVMQVLFPVLTCLNIRSGDEDVPVLPIDFLGGSAPCLQQIYLHGIPYPALPKLLLSTSNLVDLQLLHIPPTGYISPEMMAACLAALPKLETFTIRFQQFPPHPDRIHPPPLTRPVLPALTDFEFGGRFEYLEGLVAQIDSPQLERISICYYLDPHDDFQVQVTQLSEFIDRSIGPELTPSRRAHVRFRLDQVTFILSCPYPHESYPGCDQRTVATTISLDALGCHMPDVARVLSQFSAALCTVVHLELEAELHKGDQSDDVEWLHLLRQFPAMQTLHASLEPATLVFLALEDITAELVAEVLPSLSLICLEGVTASSLQKIVAIRRFSDCPITIVETREEFNGRLNLYVCT